MTSELRLSPAVCLAPVAALALVLLAACNSEPAAKPAPPPVDVKVIQTREQVVPVVNEYVGRAAAYRSVEVNARVQGIVEKRVFTEGTDVKKGDLLYVIESDTFQKNVDNAQASLRRAQADLGNAVAKEQRLAPLLKEDAISRQDYDDATTAVKQQQAAVDSAQAALSAAKIDLGYTRIVATESGRIGQTLVPEGRLVGKDGPTHMATIDKIDQVYVVFTLADRDALILRRAAEAGQITAGVDAGNVRVFLPDGRQYTRGGKLDFTDQQVNPDTGTITLRGVLPNPQRELLPGMFVRVLLDVGQRPNSVLVPQAAVVKTPTGHNVWVVTRDNKVERRDLVMGPWYKEDWIVEKGLAAGETVIIDGIQKVRAGVDVKTSPYTAPGAKPAATPPPALEVKATPKPAGK